MKEFLSAHGIAFTDRNVAADPAALAALQAATGDQTTPVIVIGEEVVIGFDRGRLQRLLNFTEKGLAL